MKKIYVVIKEKFPSEPVLYMTEYLATYAQRNSVLFFLYPSTTQTMKMTLDKAVTTAYVHLPEVSYQMHIDLTSYLEQIKEKQWKWISHK